MPQALATQVRRLNLLEYQSKGLLQESGVAIQTFRVLEGKQDEQDLNDFSKFLHKYTQPLHREYAKSNPHTHTQMFPNMLSKPKF